MKIVTENKPYGRFFFGDCRTVGVLLTLGEPLDEGGPVVLEIRTMLAAQGIRLRIDAAKTVIACLKKAIAEAELREGLRPEADEVDP